MNGVKRRRFVSSLLVVWLNVPTLRKLHILENITLYYSRFEVYFYNTVKPSNIKHHKSVRSELISNYYENISEEIRSIYDY